jgi:hypothetical protein
MKKFLLAALLAITTSCYIAAPADAGNSIRLKALGGGGGGTTELCDPTLCDDDGDILVWNNTGSCFDCVECADNQILSFDLATDTWVCDSTGTNRECPGPTPPAPVDGEALLWDAGASCFTSIGCADNQLLAWDNATMTFECIDVGNLCNAGSCTDNAIIQWNNATACYDCLTCAADEMIEWNGSDWACVEGPNLDDPATGACIDGTGGDMKVTDDLEVTDETYLLDEAWINYCNTMTFQGESGFTDANQEIALTVNNIVQGPLAAPDVGAAVATSRTLVLRNQDSGVDETNELVFARGWDTGAGISTTPYGYDLGGVWGYAWDGTDYVRQAGIVLALDTEAGKTGAMTASDGYGTIEFRVHNGVNSAYDQAGAIRADEDWEIADDLFLPNGLLGFGTTLESTATCIHSATDELFGDRDCDETPDAAENPLDTFYLEAADGTGATSSFSGLEEAGSDPNDLALLQGCANGETLIWNDGTNLWECSASLAVDHGGLSGLTDDDHARYLDTEAADTFSATNWTITADTSGGSDTKVVVINGGGGTGSTRGAELTLYGDDRAIVPGWLQLASGDSGSVEILGNNATGQIDIEQAGATTNTRLLMNDAGFSLTANANDLIAIEDTLLAFAASGASDAANGVCLTDDGADRIFHDTDCDGTKDVGEEFIDLGAGAGESNADDCVRWTAGQLDALESAFADLGTDTSGTNVRMRYRTFASGTDEYVNQQTIVPDALASSGNVTVTIWTTGDGTADGAGLDIIWSFDYSGRDDGETYDGAYTSSAFAAETYTTLNDTTLFEVTQTIAVGSFTAGDLLFLRFWRDANNASDNYDGEGRLLEAEVCFPTDAP